MKKLPNEQRVLERMAPGALCGEGFLGKDHRELSEILDTDHAAVERIGLTHRQIAERLRDILHQAMEDQGRPTSVGEHLMASYAESMGRIPCPFGGCGVFAKGEVEITDDRTGMTLRFTPLSVHLIAEHGFYQGRGTRYRINPVEAAALLDLPAKT